MKRAVWILSFPFAILLVAGCITEPARPEGYLRGDARIRKVTGAPEVTVNNHDWQSARRGLVLQDGDQARTPVGAEIEFDLGKDGGELILMPESKLIFEQLGPTGSDPEVVAVLNLIEGRIVGDTLRAPAHRKIIVKTPEGVREVR